MVRPIPTGKTAIEELLQIAESAMHKADHRNEKYRKHREAWVLGKFAGLYNTWRGAPLPLIFAEPGDSMQIPADFAVYGRDAEYISDVEVTELPDDWDWWRPGVAIPEVKDPWAPLPDLLQKKHGKAARYRHPTWLLVYDNASSGVYQELNGVMFGASDAARLHANNINLVNSSIVAIWLLSSDGRRAEMVTQ